MDTQDLRDRVALITGAGRGIGLKIAERFADSGAIVCIADVNAENGTRAAASLQERGARAEFVRVDLSLANGPQNTVRKIVEQYGRMDILVNNARSGQRVAFLEETEETWAGTLSVSLRAVFFASQEALRYMSQARSGCIVNIGSVGGLLVTPESPSYHVAKAGIIQLTRYLAVEAGKLGVRVNCVCPAFVVQDEHQARFNARDNDQYRRLAEHCHPLGTIGRSDDVAEAVIFLCSERARFINGQSIILDGGSTLYEQFTVLHDYVRRHKV